MERGGYRYERRRPETTALHRVMAEHLRRFEAEWTDEGEGRTLPGFVVGELSGYLECGVAARGFARLACESCGQRHLVAFSCGGRGFCPSCLGRAPVFHPAPGPTQGEVEDVVHRARIRILRYLERHGVVRVVAAPGEGERSLLGDEALGESDPLLARFLAAAAAGAAPAGPARKRGPVRLVVGAGVRAQPKGPLCAQDAGFNLHAATRVGASDRAQLGPTPRPEPLDRPCPRPYPAPTGPVPSSNRTCR